MKFTKKSLDAIKPIGKRQVFFDDDLPGLAIRVSEIGRISFYYSYRTGKGRTAVKKWVHIGSYPAWTPENARQKVKELAAQVTMGTDPADEAKVAKSALTVADVIQVFWLQHISAKLKPSSQRLYSGIIGKHIVPMLGKINIKDVAHRDVARLHHELRDAPYMANRTAAVLSKFFNWCEKNGYRDRNSNPAEDLEKYKERKRMDFLKIEDIEAIGQSLAALEALGQVSLMPAAALRLLHLTGARLDEILSLKWSYLDLESNLANLPDSKTGFKVLHLPISAVEILRALPKFDSDYVFPSGSKSGHLSSIRKPWAAVCAHAGLSGWRLHDLRHAFASAAVNSGASLPMIGALLGHKNSSTTARYAHVALNPAHKIAEDTGAEISEALSSVPQNGILKFAPRARAER
ncbi:integrase [Deltaproteobacteria bacterium Smac51]|nr:integrase [Deltaproteobacteria bacterium Smac51]